MRKVKITFVNGDAEEFHTSREAVSEGVVRFYENSAYGRKKTRAYSLTNVIGWEWLE